MSFTASAARRSARAKGWPRTDAPAPKLTMIENGNRVPLDLPRIEAVVRAACEGLSDYVTPDSILVGDRQERL